MDIYSVHWYIVFQKNCNLDIVDFVKSPNDIFDEKIVIYLEFIFLKIFKIL